MNAVGIDLGTTFSVVAHVDDSGLPAVIPDPAGRPTTPSIVWFDTGEVLIGEDARSAGIVEPERMVAHIKRFMGTDHTLEFDGVTYTPETISALILKALADNAAAALRRPRGAVAAVVTVPAYFGITEREATAQAAALAGIDLLDLVAEPVAAAAFYGVDTAIDGTVLVFDLGGGTFDTTVLRIRPEGPEVLVTEGESHLGGVDWSERLAALLLERFTAAAELDEDDDPTDDENFQEQLTAAADKTKIALSQRLSASCVLEYRGRRHTVELARADFERATAHLVENCVAVADRAIEAAHRRGSGALDRIVLVGGATRMPMIGAALGRHFAVEVCLTEPDLAVAKGAALHAQSLLAARGDRPLLPAPTTPAARRALALRPVRTVLPRALGILIHDSRDPAGERRIVHHLVEANTALPVTGAEHRFATILDGQDRIRVEVYEQAGATASPDLEHNRRVLDGELVDVPDLKAGSPIDIALSVGSDGRITCVAVEPKSGRTLTLESCIEGVIDAADADRQRSVVAGTRIQW
ncbi:Hsp70 family protein [Nocardia takedensis]